VAELESLQVLSVIYVILVDHVLDAGTLVSTAVVMDADATNAVANIAVKYVICAVDVLNAGMDVIRNVLIAENFLLKNMCHIIRI